MSRIGRLPIPVPSGVDIAIDGQAVSVKGPKGTLSLTVAEPISVERQDASAGKFALQPYATEKNLNHA